MYLEVYKNTLEALVFTKTYHFKKIYEFTIPATFVIIDW